jgi:hypothetical protein
MLPQCSHAGLCPTCTRGRAVSKTGQSVNSSSAPAHLQVCFHIQRHCLLGQHIRLHRTHREHAPTTVSGRPFSSWQATSLCLSATCLRISALRPKLTSPQPNNAATPLQWCSQPANRQSRRISSMLIAHVDAGLLAQGGLQSLVPSGHSPAGK